MHSPAGPALPRLLLVAAALALLGCNQGPGPAAAPPSEAQRQTPRPVRLVPAAEQTADRRVSATGTLAADEQVVLGTKVAGRIAELPVDLGSRVRRDQTVARLDPTDAQHRVDQAVAALQQARARLGLKPDGADDRVEPTDTGVVRQAKAVLDVARSLPASAAAKRPRSLEQSAIRADRLRLPAESRETLLARADATLIFAQPRGLRTEEVAARATKLARIASAMLARAGLGDSLNHAVIEGAAETTYLRADGETVLTLSFSGDAKVATALAHLERVWVNCRSELARQAAPNRVA